MCPQGGFGVRLFAVEFTMFIKLAMFGLAALAVARSHAILIRCAYLHWRCLGGLTVRCMRQNIVWELAMLYVVGAVWFVVVLS